MNTSKIITNTLFAIGCAAFINSKSFATPVQLHYNIQDIKTYHNSGNYERDLTVVAARANNYLLAEVKKNAARKQPQKLAIVLDIDETSLSTYDSMVKEDFKYNKTATYNEQLKAKAPAIAPIHTLYENALKNNVAVFFVTGRFTPVYKATVKNLKYAGYPTWTGLYLRSSSDHRASVIPFKTAARAKITKQGYTIIESVGDQISDLKGGHAQKVFKLPNRIYFIP